MLLTFIAVPSLYLSWLHFTYSDWSTLLYLLWLVTTPVGWLHFTYSQWL